MLKIIGISGAFWVDRNDKFKFTRVLISDLSWLDISDCDDPTFA